MKSNYLIFSLFLSSLLYSQTIISTKYFEFKCNCKEVENEYNPKNKSYNYTYEENDGNSIFMISVKTNSGSNPDGFLSSIKNSGTFDYQYTSFKENKAISADMIMGGEYGKHIGFFRNGIGYSVIIASTTKKMTNTLFSNFEKSFKFK